jgi:2-C-methyl-D-erythritol 2,4-cyclodiphosphate synthase/2-C-methyl-D-erythritol 4-phosphate cytidylyltransferase
MLYTIILAGGSGRRMQTEVNKVLLPLLGIPALVHTVKAFQFFGEGIILVLRPEDEKTIRALMAEHKLPIAAFVHGGADRQASVFSGLNALPEECETVLVHDGARALVTREIIQSTVDSVLLHGSGVAAIPVTDTLKEADSDGFIAQSLDRSLLRAMQTPQGFKKATLLKAHESAGGFRGTDEAELVSRLGEKVHLSAGSPENIKLTTPTDIIIAEAILSKRSKGDEMPVRIGQGYDVHRLVPNRKLILCGIEIPYEKGLLGHSDADVGLHALMDAMLGAAGLYDIGRHFSDKDAQYAGISSVTLLERVCGFIKDKGFQVHNADITLIAQAPKLLPFIERMRENIARVLVIPAEYVNIKATTTEGLGFEGEGLGITAMAVCTLKQLRSNENEQ